MSSWDQVPKDPFSGQPKQEPDQVSVKMDPYLRKPVLATVTPTTFGTTPYTPLEARQIGEQLAIPLAKRDVKFRPGPGGKRLTYIEGWKAIDIANSIFGFDGWSSQLISLDVRVCKQTPDKRWHACVMATMRITLRNGAFHEDRGGGHAENKRSEEEAMMAAEKEALTDACKRALKNFGQRLGLSLYSDDHLRIISSKTVTVNRGVASGAAQQSAQQSTKSGITGSSAVTSHARSALSTHGNPGNAHFQGGQISQGNIQTNKLSLNQHHRQSKHPQERVPPETPALPAYSVSPKQYQRSQKQLEFSAEVETETLNHVHQPENQDSDGHSCRQGQLTRQLNNDIQKPWLSKPPHKASKTQPVLQQTLKPECPSNLSPYLQPQSALASDDHSERERILEQQRHHRLRIQQQQQKLYHDNRTPWEPSPARGQTGDSIQRETAALTLEKENPGANRAGENIEGTHSVTEAKHKNDETTKRFDGQTDNRNHLSSSPPQFHHGRVQYGHAPQQIKQNQIPLSDGSATENQELHSGSTRLAQGFAHSVSVQKLPYTGVSPVTPDTIKRELYNPQNENSVSSIADRSAVRRLNSHEDFTSCPRRQVAGSLKRPAPVVGSHDARVNYQCHAKSVGGTAHIGQGQPPPKFSRLDQVHLPTAQMHHKSLSVQQPRGNFTVKQAAAITSNQDASRAHGLHVTEEAGSMSMTSVGDLTKMEAQEVDAVGGGPQGSGAHSEVDELCAILAADMQ